MALAERHDVRFEEVAPGAGSDGIVDYLSQIALDPGDEIVCGWPSFPSYVIDAKKLGAVAKTVPLRDHRYDLEAMLEAIGPRTKIVYVCHPNNPTGTMNTRAELDAFLDQVPEHVLTVLDQAYFEYIDDPEYVDGLEYLKAGRRVVVLRTFSKIYGLAGLRVGYALGPEELVTSIGKVRRAFDVSSLAQAAALASLDAPDELARRRRENAEGIVRLERIMREHGLESAEVGRELPVRRGRRGLAAALRAAPSRGRDRPADRRLRRPGRDPRHRRHARGERALRRGARPRAQRRSTSIIGTAAKPPDLLAAASDASSSIGEREAAVGEAGERSCARDISGGTSSCSRRRAAADARS